jgi:MFS family permease
MGDASPRMTRFGVLQEPQFRLLWLGQTASLAGDALLDVAVAFAVLESGGTAADLGIVFAAYMTAHVALLLVGGVWADRLPRQLVMVACDVVRAAAETVMAALLLTGSAEVWQLALGAAVVGGASSFFAPASTGLVPQTVSPGRLQQANALLSLSRTSSRIIGPALAGLIIAVSNTGVVFVLDAVTFGLSAVSLLLLRPRPRPTEASARPAQSFRADLRAGWREVVSRRWLVLSLLAFGVGNAASGFAFVLGPVIAEERLGGAAAWGLALTGTGVGGVIGGVLALRVRPSRPLRIAFLVTSLMSLPALALASGVPALVVAAALAASTIGIELANAWWFTLLQQRIPEEALSRVSSYDWLVSFVFQPTGFLLAGPLALTLGAGPTLVAAAVAVIGADAAVLLFREVRDLRWAPEGAPAAAVTAN